MANTYTIKHETLSNIADAIRAKTSIIDPIVVEDMATIITSITGGDPSNEISYTNIVYNDDDTITLIDTNQIEHIITYAKENDKITSLALDGEAIRLDYENDSLVKIGRTNIDAKANIANLIYWNSGVSNDEFINNATVALTQSDVIIKNQPTKGICFAGELEQIKITPNTETFNLSFGFWAYCDYLVGNYRRLNQIYFNDVGNCYRSFFDSNSVWGYDLPTNYSISIQKSLNLRDYKYHYFAFTISAADGKTTIKEYVDNALCRTTQGSASSIKYITISSSDYPFRDYMQHIWVADKEFSLDEIQVMSQQTKSSIKDFQNGFALGLISTKKITYIENTLLQDKTVTPTTSQQIIIADSEYDGLNSVTINGDANLVAENIVSGVNIFGIEGTAITGGGGGAAVIARTITEYTSDEVTSVGDYAFYSYSNLISVDLPNATTIGWSAFYNCKNLISVNFPNATSIGYYAFSSCTNLTSISFPKVTTIQNQAFYGCSKLTSVNFPNATDIGNIAFYNCSNLTSIDFPNATTIGSSAFEWCSKLTSVSFPNAITIGSYAFRSCHSLASVSFPNVTNIGSYAFYSCTKLASVDFPNATAIDGCAFSYCTSLTSVSFPKVTYIGALAFCSCYTLTSVDFPNATTIGGKAFSQCSKLTSANFPNATTIAYNAFYGCGSLTSVSFPKVTTIGSYVFYGCQNLTSVSFPNAITIGSSAFYYCTKLSSIYLGASVVCTLSASNAFYNTGIWSDKGSIFVPASLLTSYQAATNWTYFSNRIFAYEFDEGTNPT